MDMIVKRFTRCLGTTLWRLNRKQNSSTERSTENQKSNEDKSKRNGLCVCVCVYNSVFCMLFYH